VDGGRDEAAERGASTAAAEVVGGGCQNMLHPGTRGASDGGAVGVVRVEVEVAWDDDSVWALGTSGAGAGPGGVGGVAFGSTNHGASISEVGDDARWGSSVTSAGPALSWSVVGAFDVADVAIVTLLAATPLAVVAAEAQRALRAAAAAVQIRVNRFMAVVCERPRSEFVFAFFVGLTAWIQWSWRNEE
jgi:hypothetical protein